MKHEILDFYITSFIKDRDNNIKELNKRVSLKIDWRTDRIGTRGFLNPKWEKYIRVDGRHDPKADHWKGEGEVIQFEKDGEKYDIWVNFIVKEGWFRDRIVEQEFRAFPSDYSNGETPNAPFTCGTGHDREVKGQMKHEIILEKEKRLVSVNVIVVLVVISIFILFVLFAWMRKRTKK